jgi:fructokinase
MRMRLGLDLGGTKIAALVLDGKSRVIWERRVATPRDDYDATLAAIASLVSAADEAAGEPCTIGLGIPGAISPATGLVKNANSTWLIGRPLDHDLEARLGRPVRIENDANCLAMSEAADGAAAGMRVAFAVILGTGVGGGIAVDGRIVTGVNAIAGEWGHNPMPWADPDERPGPACYCGRTGCIETFLSGPGLARDYAARGGDAVPGELVVSRAAGGDAPARASLDAWERRLAKSLASVINILDPEVIVLGGGLSRIDRVYASVPTQWAEWVFSDTVRTRLEPARFGDASGVRGAARLWGQRGIRRNLVM